MKSFEYFLKVKDVVRRRPDNHLAKATIRDSLDRIEMARNILGKEKPKYVLENAYEAIRETIDAVLYSKGYKSYSHEASVSFLQNLGFPESDVSQVNNLRQHRNGIKYYGEESTVDESERALEVAKKIIDKILSKTPELKP